MNTPAHWQLEGTPRSLESMCIQDWNIPFRFHKFLDIYGLISIQSHTFIHSESYSTLRYEGVDYSLYYYECMFTDLEKWSTLFVSLRKIKGWSRGYALIRPKLGTEK